ncbi:MAG: FKBP-type peptidyl-prolyl cis-trans isomerase [archaeon]
MNKGDIIVINYTGKDLASGKVFDTTDEETAKKEEIYEERIRYRALPVIIGNKELLPALEEKVQELREKEEKVIELTPEKAFGERKSELIRVVPLMEFQKRNMNPFPGMPVEMNELRGKVQSVSGGRVRVDFNHELAGKKIEYKVKVEKILSKKEEKVEALVEKYFPVMDDKKIEFKGEEVEIIIPGKNSLAVSQVKPLLAKNVLDFVEGVKKIRFIDEFSKETEKNKSQEEEK